MIQIHRVINGNQLIRGRHQREGLFASAFLNGEQIAEQVQEFTGRLQR